MHQVFHSTARGVPDAVLHAMFVARKRVFVDLLKWDIPVLDGRFEIDQFDDAHATYLVLADRDGAHLGSARLLQTARPHILGDLFPGLCEGAPPRGDDIFGVKVRGITSIRQFLTAPRALQAIRRFNLTHMNRGRNAYQASHCYSLADHMLGEEDAG
mgnify:CR=1 FL=1